MQFADAIAHRYSTTPHAGTVDAARELNRLVERYGVTPAVCAVAVGSWVALVTESGDVIADAHTGLGVDRAIEQLHDTLVANLRALRALVPTHTAAEAA